MKNAAKPGALFPPHLDDTEILAYLDGELLLPEMERARAHLESCWNCRARVTALQASIDTFVGVRKSLLPDVQRDSEQRVEQFRQRLMRHAAETHPSSPISVSNVFGNAFKSWGSILWAHQRFVLTVGVIACLLVAMFTDVLNTRVSADTVLLRAQTYESAYTPKRGQVHRSSIRISHFDRKRGQERQLASLTLVQDSLTPAAYLQSQLISGESRAAGLPDAAQLSSFMPQILTTANFPPELLQYLQTENWFPDPSVEQFRKLVAGREDDDTSARRQGTQFELHYPFAAHHNSGIAEALLTVDSQSYSPLQVTIVTADQNSEFRFRRTASTLEPRTEEIARLFPPGDLQAPSSASSAPRLAKPVPLSYLNSQASANEVVVSAALHKIDACLGEEVNVFPMSDGSILVQGLVDRPERRAAIRQALKVVNASVRVQIYLPQEVKTGAELLDPPDHVELPPTLEQQVPPGAVASISSERIPMYDQLYQHFSNPDVSPQDTERQIADFSSQVVMQARQSFLHAWALRKLDREYAPGRISALGPNAVAEIEKMRQDHRLWISEFSHRQAGMLQKIAPNLAPLAPASTSAPQDSDTLLQLAREQDDLVRSLFTRSHYAQDPNGNLVRLHALLQRLGS